MIGIFLDIETTGLDPTFHRPIDIAIVLVDLNQNKNLAVYQALINPTLAEWEKSDPDSLKINGYDWNQIQSGKSMEEVKNDILALFARFEIKRGKSVFICQNPAFDRGFFNQIIDVYEQENLFWPYHWLDLASMYWTTLKPPYPGEKSLSKNQIAKSLSLPPEKLPHHAINGAMHLLECYRALSPKWRSS